MDRLTLQRLERWIENEGLAEAKEVVLALNCVASAEEVLHLVPDGGPNRYHDAKVERAYLNHAAALLVEANNKLNRLVSAAHTLSEYFSRSVYRAATLTAEQETAINVLKNIKFHLGKDYQRIAHIRNMLDHPVPFSAVLMVRNEPLPKIIDDLNRAVDWIKTFIRLEKQLKPSYVHA